MCQDKRIVKIDRRPSQGTTVSIYGFHELSLKKWDIAYVYHLIANIAIMNPQVNECLLVYCCILSNLKYIANIYL